MDEHGFTSILLLRALGAHFGVISYAAGMTKIRYKDFIIATLVGAFPYTFIYAFAGFRLMDVKSSSFIYWILIFKLILFSAFVLGYFVYKRLKTRKTAIK